MCPMRNQRQINVDIQIQGKPIVQTHTKISSQIIFKRIIAQLTINGTKMSKRIDKLCKRMIH